MYNKIFKNICFLCAFGIILCIAITLLFLGAMGTLNLPSAVFILIMGFLIFLLCQHIAAKLTTNILKPLEKPLSPDANELYDEILPLAKTIESQSAEIKRQAEDAQSREIQFRHITENMNEGLILLDGKGYIISANKFAKQLFETGEYEANGKHFSFLTKNHLFTDAVTKALDNTRSNTVLELGDAFYRIYCSPLHDDASDTGVIILVFEITSTYQSEKLRREFSANVSHELKTPLTSIHGFAQLISSGIAKEADIPDFAGKIAKESNRLMMLIEDIMRLSNLDESTAEKVTSRVNIKETVLEVISSLEEKAKKRGVSINFSGSDYILETNETLIGELLYNLCDNAIKYNKDNGSIDIVLHDNTLAVSDTGIGIPQEYLTRIFERFFRVDKSHSKKVDGTGLGLSIVKHIALQLNVEIDVKSTLGEGTTFTLRFPSLN